MRADAAPSFAFTPELPGPGERFALPDEEAHYLIRVCRVREDDRVRATDGRGAVATLRITGLRGGVTAEVMTLERLERRRCGRILCGAPEGERADWLIEKLAELGLESFQPVDCDRGKWSRAAERRARWLRLARAALRQSQGRFAMDVCEATTLEAALAAIPDGTHGWAADVAGTPAALVRAPTDGIAVGVIGPAGGFSPREREALVARDFGLMALAANRLRTETAALAWAAWWSSAAA